MAENLAYRHIKVTQQTRVDGLGSSGLCHGVHRVSNIGGLRQQKLIHRNTLHCTALPGLGTGAGRHAALRQLAHNLGPSCHCFAPPCTAHCWWSPPPCGSSISRQLGSRAECEPGPGKLQRTDHGHRDETPPGRSFHGRARVRHRGAGPAAGPVTLPCYGWI